MAGPTLLIHRRGLVGARRSGLRQQLREWLKTLRKKNASVVSPRQSLSDIDAATSRRPSSEICHDAYLPANEARHRAADHRDLSPLRLERSARSRSSPAPRRSATTTANPVVATVCSSWVSAGRARRSAPPLRRPTRGDRTRRRRNGLRCFTPAGLRTTNSCGPPISSRPDNLETLS